MKKTILFGASNRGMQALEKLAARHDIVFFTDNDPEKWGNTFAGLEVINPKDLIGKTEYKIIIASQYDAAIARQLFDYGVREFSLFQPTYQGQDRCLQDFSFEGVDSLDPVSGKIALLMQNYSGSNTLALYRQAPAEILEKYSIVLLDEVNRQPSFYTELLTASLVVKTHESANDPAQKTIQLWHGFPLKALGMMQGNEQVWAQSKNWQNLAAIASYSPLYSTLMNACFGVSGTKYRITGLPRNDFLFKSDGLRLLAEILGHDFKGQQILFYMPTFRQTVFGEENGDSRRVITPELLSNRFSRYLVDNNLALVVKLHPFDEQQAMMKTALKESNIFSLSDRDLQEHQYDFYELLTAADLLITDYSSIYFDYLLLDRPIIFTPGDLNEYSQNRGLLMTPYNSWTPGPKCSEVGSLEAEINKSLEDADYYRQERMRLRDIVHTFQDGHASERTWQLITAMLDPDDNRNS